MNSELLFLDSLTPEVLNQALERIAATRNNQATADEPIASIEQYLLAKYQRWRHERSITCNFDGDIRHLLCFRSIRLEVVRVFFQSVGKPSEQIDIATTLLIQAAYHRYRLRSDPRTEPTGS